MEQSIDQEEYRKLISAYLGPDSKNEIELSSAERMLEKFPFCQSLHLMYVAGLKKEPEKFEKEASRLVSLVPQREILHHALHHPEKLTLRMRRSPVVSDEEIEETEENVFTDINAGSDDTGTATHNTVLEETKSHQPDLQEHEDTGSDNVEPEVIENGPDISSEVLESEEADMEDNVQLSESIDHEIESKADVEQHKHDDSEKSLAPDNTGSADHFTLEQSIADILKHKDSPENDNHEPDEYGEVQGKAGEIAHYDDYKLPYTFLWWLHKTRKEHSETYQPYASFRLDTSRPIKRNENDELDKQIIENIFHLQPVIAEEHSASSNTIEFELKRKEDDIIEKFIKEDPQIRPMPPEKISNENKARKSAEDSYDLVSETLARIYTDQMLYHKAIDAYNKLSLKFPEKKAYFADQILELEKKIN